MTIQKIKSFDEKFFNESIKLFVELSVNEAINQNCIFANINGLYVTRICGETSKITCFYVKQFIPTHIESSIHNFIRRFVECDY